MTTSTLPAISVAEEPLIDLRDALRALGLRKSDRQVLRWRLQHGLPCYRIAGRLYARVGELRGWVAAQRQNAPPSPVLDQRAADAVLAAHGLPRGKRAKAGARR